ncbi:MAG: GGDEF domain-containing protein [Patescibacteria group bacterium]
MWTLLVVAVLALIWSGIQAWQNKKLKTELRLVQSQLDRDGLTGLFNEGYLKQALHREMERAIRTEGKNPLAVLFIDGDNFKQINDNQGHEAGDVALKQLANVLTGRIRDYDIAARNGGDEFVVILPNTTLVSAAGIAEDIRTTVAEKTEMKISIGVSYYPESCKNKSWKALLDESDQMMYRAKEMGGNRAVSTL